MLAIHPSFLEFLRLLSQKKEGEPLARWQDNLDFLTVFIGEGDCRAYVLGGFIAPHLDIIWKLYPKEGEDPLVGFQISGGIRALLRIHYKELLKDGYLEFAVRHNSTPHWYHASELFEMWLEKFPAEKPQEVGQIREALKRQNPTVHIPL